MGFLDSIGFRGNAKSTPTPSGGTTQATSGENQNGNMNFRPANNNNNNNGAGGNQGGGNSGFDAQGNPISNNNGNNNNWNNGNNGNPGGGNNGNAPSNGQSNDPFAFATKLWDNPANPETPPAFALDPAQLKTVAGAQDFMKGINPELMEKARTGDSTAIMEMMHQVARNSYEASLGHTAKLTEGFVTARETHASKQFGGNVKGELTKSTMSSIPGWSNPVVRKQLTQHAEALQRVHPDASPQEIVTMVKEYVTGLAAAINPSKEAQEKPKNEKTDWDAWFEDEKDDS